MGDKEPLDHPELRDIDRLLDQLRIAEAQIRLAQLGDAPELSIGVAYLSTRLLHLRGRLEARAATERLRDLLEQAPGFKEARTLLSQLDASATAPETVPVTRGARVSEPIAEPRRATPGELPRERKSIDRLPIPSIPRAPGVPDFQDNFAPPSYVPNPTTEDVIDPLRSKSLLPRDAGRYSENPETKEVTYQARRSGEPSAEAASRNSRAARPTVGHTPQQRSVSAKLTASRHPSSGPLSSLPSLFELATWIDQGRHADAIAAIDGCGATSPVYALLRARALWASGSGPQAIDALAEIERGGPLEPELGASCARLYVELGEPGRALRLSEQSLRADSKHPLVRLTYALSAVRMSRHDLSPGLLELAGRVLHRMEGQEGPLPSLYQALKACVLAGTSDPEGAAVIAQRALGLDPRSIDAIAAIAEASARLGRVDDARQAWNRLSEVSPPDAAILSRFLSHLGVSMGPSTGPRPPNGRPLLWSETENALGAGKRSSAIIEIENTAQETARRIGRTMPPQSGLSAIATVAATYFTTAPVFGSFAPYDSSLWSIRRLSAALDVLYGNDPRPDVASDDAGLVLFVGSYLGETLRVCHDGRWEGRLEELDSACVLFSDQRRCHPFRIVTARLHEGRRSSIVNALAGTLETPGSPAWRARKPSTVSPPTAWAPDPWPPPSQLGDIARSLARSPIGKYCQDQADAVLDGSATSFIALDSYLDLVAPRGSTVSPDSGWARRVAVLSGAYVGETLRNLIGGNWVFGVDGASDAHGFRLRLQGSVEATPIAHVLERVAGQRSSGMVDYAKVLMRRSERT